MARRPSRQGQDRPKLKTPKTQGRDLNTYSEDAGGGTPLWGRYSARLFRPESDVLTVPLDQPIEFRRRRVVALRSKLHSAQRSEAAVCPIGAQKSVSALLPVRKALQVSCNRHSEASQLQAPALSNHQQRSRLFPCVPYQWERGNSIATGGAVGATIIQPRDAVTRVFQRNT